MNVARRSTAMVVGAVAAAAQSAAAELVARRVPGAGSPGAAVGRALIDLMPGPVVDSVVGTLEDRDKQALALSLMVAALAAGGAAGALERRTPGRGPIVLAGLAAASGLAVTRRPDRRTGAGLAGPLVGTGVGVGVLRGRIPANAAVAGAAIAAAGAHWSWRHQRTGALDRAGRHAGPMPESPVAELRIPGLTPLFTRTDDFYVTDVAFGSPVVDPRSWRLRVGGLVREPLSLSLDELHALGVEALDATLVCVHNPVGGSRIGTARWHGVPLARLLKRAGVEPTADRLLARTVDGFSALVPLDRLAGPALLALGMNGGPLPVEHGFPARLLVPGLWGADANPKWLSELTLADASAPADYWDRRGWPADPPPVKPGSRIDVPRDHAVVSTGEVTVAGVAWAPPDGVDAVEVAVDDEEWRPAVLGPELAPTAWRQWRWAWQASAGPHELRVRARGRSRTQNGRVAPPYPDGSSGLHRVRVEVTSAPEPAPGARRRGRVVVSEAALRLELVAGAADAWSRRDRGA